MTCARAPTAVGLLALVLLMTVLGLPQAQAQRLGRLFTTPEQRVLLDEIRTQAQFAEPELEPEVEPQPNNVAVTEQRPSGPSIANLTINGVVRRRGGRTTVWVNGREIDRGDVTREGVLVESARARGGDVRLRLPSGTETVDLRPGQKIDIGTGTVLEPYEQSPSGNTQGAFRSAAESESTQPSVPSSSTSALSPDDAAESADTNASPDGATSAVGVLEQIEALTKAARAAMGRGAAPASP